MPYIHYPRLRGSYDDAVGQHLISLYGCRVKHKNGRIRRVKSWEIIADRLSKAGWSLGCVSADDSCGRTIFVADAHRDEKR
jgi:hypothetical protein